MADFLDVTDHVREISTRDELVAVTGPQDLFARYGVPERLDGGWVLGGAVGYLRESRSGRHSLTAWGPLGDLARLVPALDAAGVLSPDLDHLSVPAPDAETVLAGRPSTDGGAWDWMATRTSPPRTPVEDRVVDLDDAADAAELQALADRENPLSEGFPGTGRSERWVGVRDEAGAVVACAAVHRLSSGAPHLCGIITARSHRGQGLGRAMTALLTRDLLEREPVVTLGMYADNVVARALYHSLGYVTDKAWWSCRLV